jgi:hypothetical protein
MIISVIIIAAITLACVSVLMILIGGMAQVIDAAYISVRGYKYDKHDNADMPDGTDSLCDTHIN